MEFGLTEEQRLLQDSLTGHLRSHADLDTLRAAAADLSGPEAQGVRRGLVALGVAGIVTPQSHGGAGLGMMEAALAAEALGAAAAAAPMLSWVLAARALLEAGTAAQQERWLGPGAAGEAVLGIGLSQTAAQRGDDGICAANERLTGAAAVLDAADVAGFVLADTDGRLYLVPADAPEVSVSRHITIDQTRALGRITLDGAPAELLPGSANSAAAFARVLDAGRVLLAADTLGAAQTMLDRAVAYAGERRQFGQVIGSFQAVKHMCAEMAAELEPCRALVWYAAHCLDTAPGAADAPDPATRAMACHAKAQTSDVGRFVARTATEVHGGMGFTDLLGLHYWFKRIEANRQLLGGPQEVRADAARIQGWTD